MEQNDIEAAITKLQYHNKILAGAIDCKQNAVEALILQMDWDEREIRKVYDVFDRWDKLINDGVALTSASFEEDFNVIDIDYLTLKSVILAFHRNSKWADVCQAYVDSFGGGAALEYNRIMRRERS